MKDTLIGILFFGFMFLSLFFSTYLMEEMKCSEQSVSFKDWSYKLISGCMVLTDEGKWLPLTNVREGF